MSSYILIVVFVLSSIILMLIFAIGRDGFYLGNNKKLVQDEANAQELNVVNIQQFSSYGDYRAHYRVFYLDEKNIGHAKECIVYKKTVYWLD